MTDKLTALATAIVTFALRAWIAQVLWNAVAADWLQLSFWDVAAIMVIVRLLK